MTNQRPFKRPLKRLCRIALVAMFLAVPAAFGQPIESVAGLRCVVVADDFVPRAARVVRIDGRAIEYRDEQTNQSTTLPLERLVRLERFGAAESKLPFSTIGPFLFILRNGERVSGTPGTLAGDDLRLDRSNEVGVGDDGGGVIPLKSIVAIAAVRHVPVAEIERATPPAATQGTQDELLLTNGDAASGVVSASDSKTVTIQSADGQTTVAEWDNVRLLRLAAVAAPDEVPTRPAPFRLTLGDGRIVDGDLVVDDKHNAFHAARGGRFQPVNAERIVAIEHRGGRARMLADVAPAARTHAAYFPAGPRAAAAAAPPLTLEGRTLRSTIHVRPRGAITWPLDGSMRTFVARYALPDGRPLADVTVRVRLDGAVVHERQHVRSGKPSEIVRLPLGQARSITLEVDYGDHYDVQDDLYWIDAALLPE